MEKHYKVTRKFSSPIWANIVTLILGMVIGGILIAEGIIYFVNVPTTSYIYIIFGIVYLAFGIAMLVMGILGLVKHRKPRMMFSYCLELGLFYAILSFLSSIYNLYFYASIYGQVTYAEEKLIVIYWIIGASIGLLAFLAVAILETIASVQLKKKKNFKAVALSANTIFASVAMLGTYGAFNSVRVNGFWPLLINLAVLAFAAFLLVVSIMTEIKTKKTLVDENGEEIPEPVEEPASQKNIGTEEEKAKLLMMYKDLLDKGAITEEEYEAKKKELL